MQNKQEVADAIFKSIDVIVDRKLSKLAFDRTVVGEIIDGKLTDKGYKIQYQDLVIYAQPIGAFRYQQGDIVYILIPNNSSKRIKFIIGNISTSQTRFRNENTVLKEVIQLMIDGNATAAQEKLNELKEDDTYG